MKTNYSKLLILLLFASFIVIPANALDVPEDYVLLNLNEEKIVEIGSEDNDGDSNYVWFKIIADDLDNTSSRFNINFIINSFEGLELSYLYVYRLDEDDEEEQTLEYNAYRYLGYEVNRISLYGLRNGTYFLRVFKSSYYGDAMGEFSINYNTSKFTTGFDYTQFGKTVKIQNYTTAYQYEWDFGDYDNYSVSYTKFPEYTYSAPGEYLITQRVWINDSPPVPTSPRGFNADQTNGKVVVPFEDNNYIEDSKIVVIKGVDRIYPTRAAIGGDFTLMVYGRDLDDTTEVKLINGDIVLEPTETVKILGGILCEFDLHFGELGIYDVSVKPEFDDDATMFYQSLTIDYFKYPKVTSDITGYNILRTGLSWPYNLKLTNTGDVTARGVNAYLAVANDVQFSSNLNTFSSTIDPEGSFDYYDEELDQHFSISNEKVIALLDSLTMDYLEIDSLFGEEFNAKVYSFYIPRILPGATLSIPFTVKALSTSQSEQSKIISFVEPINIYGSCETPNATDKVNQSVDLLLAGLESAPIVDKNPYAKALFKSLNLGKTALRNAANYAGYRAGGMSADEAFSEAYIKNGQLDKANAEAIAGLRDWALDLGVDKAKSISSEHIADLKKNSANLRREALKSDKSISPILNNMALTNDQRLERVEMMRDILNGVSDFKSNVGNLQKMIDYGEITKNEIISMLDDCPELQKQLLDLLKNSTGGNTGKDNKNKKDLTVGSSVDPNEIIGSYGYGNEQYIDLNQRMNYTISFENLETAMLPAQIVNVYDTLDITKFDLSTFELQGITIANTYIPVPPGLTEYYTRHDMRPNYDFEVGISAKLNTDTGVIHWQFVTLEPNSDYSINNPIDGFLPPNTDAPNGEGSVAFGVSLRNDLANNDVIENRADIIFDTNEAIITNTWLNTIDIESPVGSVDAISLINDTTFTVNLNGIDTGSNIRYYELFVSKDEDSFVSVGNIYGDNITYTGELYSNYAFCAIPVDSVGNRQLKDILEEKSITLIPAVITSIDDNTKNKIEVYPNPATEFLTIQINNIHNELNHIMEIIDINGKVFNLGQYSSNELIDGIQINVQNYIKGLYVLRISSKDGIIYNKFVIK